MSAPWNILKICLVSEKFALSNAVACAACIMQKIVYNCHRSMLAVTRLKGMSKSALKLSKMFALVKELNIV